jgi:hypothetical protein
VARLSFRAFGPRNQNLLWKRESIFDALLSWAEEESDVVLDWEGSRGSADTCGLLDVGAWLRSASSITTFSWMAGLAWISCAMTRDVKLAEAVNRTTTRNLMEYLRITIPPVRQSYLRKPARSQNL